MSEFLALLAIESHRTAAQHIEVAGSKGNTSQTFANTARLNEMHFSLYNSVESNQLSTHTSCKT